MLVILTKARKHARALPSFLHLLRTVPFISQNKCPRVSSSHACWTRNSVADRSGRSERLRPDDRASVVSWRCLDGSWQKLRCVVCGHRGTIRDILARNKLHNTIHTALTSKQVDATASLESVLQVVLTVEGRILQALRSMYPDEALVHFTAEEEATLSAAQTAVDSGGGDETASTFPSAISGRVTLEDVQVEGEPVVISFQFPGSYPLLPPSFRILCSSCVPR